MGHPLAPAFRSECRPGGCGAVVADDDSPSIAVVGGVNNRDRASRVMEALLGDRSQHWAGERPEAREPTTSSSASAEASTSA